MPWPGKNRVHHSALLETQGKKGVGEETSRNCGRTWKAGEIGIDIARERQNRKNTRRGREVCLCYNNRSSKNFRTTAHARDKGRGQKRTCASGEKQRPVSSTLGDEGTYRQSSYATGMGAEPLLGKGKRGSNNDASQRGKDCRSSSGTETC